MTENKRFNLDNFDSTREMLELLDTQRLIISDMEKENEELKKENERLKRENEVQKDTIEALTETISHFDMEEVINDD